jgi:hypothetical protein
MAEQPATMSGRAAELFAAWIAAGAPTYRRFAAICAEQGRYKSGATALSCINKFSARYGWQERKAAALTDAATAELEEAARIDARTFRRTSEILADRVDEEPLPLDAVVKIRESARPKAARGDGPTVNVTIYQQAEAMAKRLGITVDEFMADVERAAAQKWDA